ncbi:S-adenosyl-L-methionine-dependent methyltransferase [Ceraceosorus guamensis]|uniref:S-adenosyl-L-methionine-dependent methyltransferase n=1 Tax=Ceraceosorus guamensis TaxID=1522189 RepID=A0A316W8M5_9BASI|nr:S-adenosyl-L-methionine-dependent methyltransferase [Ceraceosorus guamensis]PWN45914.1 S-adenosyl-L-methionine-dependent methyltransferase [Ceraceosorus guamensis]
MSSLSEYAALKAQVLSSLDRYESVLKEGKLSEPSLNGTQMHETDHPGYLASKDFWDARDVLVAALGALKNTVQSPANRLQELSVAHHISAALQVAVRANAADQLAAAGPQGLPATDLAKAVGLHPAKLTKVLRFLANMNIFNEVTEGVFANNRASSLLVTSNPVRDFVSWQTSFSLKAAPQVADNLFDPKKGLSLDPLDCAVGTTYQIRESGHTDMWGRMAELTDMSEFARAMSAFGDAGNPGWVADYPWDSLGDTTLVDVGGGHGALTLPLLQAFPHFKGVIQDRLEVEGAYKTHFEQKLPEALSSNRVKFEVYDFFNDVQPHKGDGFTYMMRWILHDWPDYKCEIILKLIAAAMSPKSKLIIVDTILQPASIVPKDANPADLIHASVWPLPRSQGAAGQFKMNIDFEMMQALNATERTPKDFDRILNAAGLKRTGMYKCRAQSDIVEAMLA